MLPESSTQQTSPTSSEQIRREYLNHEASVRSIGTLYYLGAVLCVFAFVTGLVDERPLAMKIGFSALFAGLLFVYVKVGGWLRALDPKAKTPATILAAIGLLAVPLGTLINIYILYLLRSKKGDLVFSDEYKRVISETPQIRYRTSVLVWILVIIIGVGLVAACIIPLLKR